LKFIGQFLSGVYKYACGWISNKIKNLEQLLFDWLVFCDYFWWYRSCCTSDTIVLVKTNATCLSVCSINCSANLEIFWCNVVSCVECGALEVSCVECGALEVSCVECGALELSCVECGALELSCVECVALELSCVECGALEGPTNLNWTGRLLYLKHRCLFQSAQCSSFFGSVLFS